MKKVILTGASGILGMALIQYLTERNIEVTAVLRPGSPKNKNFQSGANLSLVECTLSDLGRLSETLPSCYDAFFHLGWEGTGREQRNDPFTQSRNIGYTLEAVSLAQKLGCDVFLGAGSQAEYGRTDKKLSCTTEINPDNSYGVAKYAAGKMSRILCNNYGIKHIWTRILSTYGPYDGSDTMISKCIKAFLNGEKISFTPAEQTWDYIYCGDAACALFLAAKEGKNNSVYCIGSGQARPLKDFILEIKNMLAPQIEDGIGELPYQENQVMHLCADITSLSNDTGFKPQISFKEGIKETVKWIQSQKQ